MTERTNTNQYELKPVGSYILEITKVLKKSIGPKEGRQYPGYEWSFEIRNSDKELEDNNFKHFMFKSQMADLLRTLGAKEVAPNDFEWEMDEQIGKCIKCELIHQDVNGKIREGLIEIKLYTDFAPKTKTDEPKAWDE